MCCPFLMIDPVKKNVKVHGFKKKMKWTNQNIFYMVSQISIDKQTFYIDLLIAKVNIN